MLDNFRKIDLVWNNAYEKLGNVRTAQFDEKGRKLVVQVTDDGDIVDLTGAELKLVTIDGIEVGGRNLILNSLERELAPRNTGNATDNYNFETFTIDASNSTEHTISFEHEITKGEFDSVTIIGGYQDGGRSTLVPLNTEGRTSHTFKSNNSPKLRTLVYAGMIGRTIGNGIIFRNIQIEKGNIATDWTPAPEDLQFPFDLIDAQKGIYELYFPKFFVDRYTGKTKVFLELTTKDFSVTSEPFYINVFEGVK